MVLFTDPRRAVRLTSSVTVLGRASDADISISSDGVSRAHARIVATSPGSFQLEDLDSTNGTFRNGVRVQRVRLREGDLVQLGPDILLRFTLAATQEVLDASLVQQPNDPRPRPELTLSPRELEVARAVARGLTNSAIADELGIRLRTVTSHLDHIYTRLGIRSRTDLARIVITAGLHDPR